MGRTYAGILGVLAFLTTMARGLFAAAPPESVLLSACLSLVAFAAIGLVLGGLANAAVEEAATRQVDAEWREE